MQVIGDHTIITVLIMTLKKKIKTNQKIFADIKYSFLEAYLNVFFFRKHF